MLSPSTNNLSRFANTHGYRPISLNLLSFPQCKKNVWEMIMNKFRGLTVGKEQEVGLMQHAHNDWILDLFYPSHCACMRPLTSCSPTPNITLNSENQHREKENIVGSQGWEMLGVGSTVISFLSFFCERPNVIFLYFCGPFQKKSRKESGS